MRRNVPLQRLPSEDGAFGYPPPQLVPEGIPGRQRLQARRGDIGNRPGIKRSKTLTRPDRRGAGPPPLIYPTRPTTFSDAPPPPAHRGSLFIPGAGPMFASTSKRSWWTTTSRMATWFIPDCFLSFLGGMKQPLERRAWREKLMVVMLALLMGGVTGFFTMGLNRVMCPNDESQAQAMTKKLGSGDMTLGIKGYEFNVIGAKPQPGVDFSALAMQLSGQDITSMFDRRSEVSPACQGLETDGAYASSSLCGSNTTIRFCVLPILEDTTFETLGITNTSKYVGYSWTQISRLPEYMVLNGQVLDLGPYLAANPDAIPGDAVDQVIRDVLFHRQNSTTAVGSKDATRLFYNTPQTVRAVRCISQRYFAGRIDEVAPGCMFSSIIMYVALVVILGIILIKFLMALIFSWWLAPRMCREVKSVQGEVAGMRIAWGKDSGAAAVSKGYDDDEEDQSPTESKPRALVSAAQIGAELFTLCLVTCYSESRVEIQGTLDSIAHTTYSASRKLMFVVCDGMVKGRGETQTTPEICVALLERDKRFGGGEPEPRGYIAVGEGSRRENAARVYAGHYRSTKGYKVPMLVIVKCGSAAEHGEATGVLTAVGARAGQGKTGNRGKRDSQMILMNFIMRVNYNERFTPLDFDLFRKVYALAGVSADLFEAVLMVDADTRIYPDSLTTLINCLHNDPTIMGICGETRIANKRTSWITAIQVFEYYVSHHLAKAFESVFGGVTCLPGCFSMYRLKARKGDGGEDWVPILAQPSVCQTYSQSEVSTLHEKSLLELGEDRFLSTLMIRTFPRRKMVFCPAAKCKTVVPDTFSVLLSQRRRWIGSSIHNLFELAQVPNLCGVFCFSYQFLVVIELIGTLTLPVAICLSYALSINMILNPPTTFQEGIPVLLLIASLVLPALLIVFTTRQASYVLWMFVYLVALPIWNFVLPVYAFWRLDDLSWGDTRRVEGETKQKQQKVYSEDKTAVFDGTSVPLRRWADWEKSRLRKLRRDELRRQHAAAVEEARRQNQLLNAKEDARFDTATHSIATDEWVDKWGAEIGGYDEHAPEYPPPPVVLPGPIQPGQVFPGFHTGPTTVGGSGRQMTQHGFS
ncbi:hypothetical protein QFC22_006085 [Naganishia vaughanmartiniae]|uniref:Uncharacterized protein n=1 Tax=Naganishia vaughanmartiniae TaxID=1424756 RepID=A0ACC2WQZ2_9TREE|nr:hypothetical protein QFC22_006085 [Naganishia vaughanmartiniae]